MARPVGRRANSAGRIRAAAEWVTVDKTASDTYRDLMRQAAPKTSAVVEEEMGALEEATRAKWPVKTGNSRASIDLVTSARKGAVLTSVLVRAPYAYYVKSKQIGGKFAHKALIFDRVTNLADRMARRIADALAKK